MSDGDPAGLIDVDRLVERTAELIRIPSINPFDGPGDETTGERRVAEWLAHHLDRLGYEPELTDPEGVDMAGRPNVVGVGPGGDGPTLCLAGHTDTVGVGGYDDPLRGEVADGRIHGRGACDMKGALAAFVEVAEVLHAAGRRLDGRLMIAGVADEEHGMLGSAALGADGPVADLVIVGEPTELQVCIAHKGQYAFPVYTFGTAVHSSIADQGVNAIESMMAVISALTGYGRGLRAGPGHAMCGHGSINVGTISGGETVSIVPDRCEIHVDRRLLPGESSAAVHREVTALLEELSATEPDLRWEIGEPMVDAAPLHTPADHPLVGAALSAMGRATGRSDTRPTSFTGATDAPNLKAPAVIWGPGSLSLAHTTAESIGIDELTLAVRVYLDTVETLIG